MCSCVQLCSPILVYVREFIFIKESLFLIGKIPIFAAMSDICVYIKLPAYEREWCHHHFGNPAKFPSHTNINSVIRHFIKTPPKNAVPETRQPDETAIVIPVSNSKRPEYYHYLTKPGKAAIAEAIDDIFTIHMWESLTGAGCRNVMLSKLIMDWMLSNGISQDNYDNLRQKFTRIKEAYRKEAGVNLSRGYKHENN